MIAKKKIAGLFVAVISLCIMLHPATSSAAFNANKIIDDGVFNNTGTMSADQIDAFLNNKGSCLSPNSGFSARDPVGYSPSGGYQYGGNVSAGTVIAHAAQAYDLNPQVLIVTLQKEQSLITTSSCSTNTISKAMGYACPDGGSSYSYSGLNLYTRNGTTYTSVSGICVNSAAKAGFTQQVIRAAWLLKFGQQRSVGNTGWAIIRGNWDNSDDLQSCYSGPMTEGYRRACPSSNLVYYDGLRSIDGTTIHIDNGATAALYWYTPHFHGNQNFVSRFEDWFGSTDKITFLWQKVSMRIWDETKSVEMGTDNLHKGERLFVELKAKNTGNQIWWRDHSQQARLGTDNPKNMTSHYCDVLWLNCNRAAVLKEASVAPGETGTFEFYIHAPNEGGVFREYFEPVLETHSWMDNDEGYHIYVNSTDNYDWRWLYFDAWTDQTKTTRANMDSLARGQEVYVELKTRNSSATVWRNTGANPTRLGTQRPQDHNSFLCMPSWVGCNRAATISESTVNPGGVATFAFTIKAPSTIGQYREYMKPVIEHKGWMRDNPNHIFLNVTH